ncbi:MAG: hypothetical protein RLY57_510 [Candidatus Parcubacteria bacterium]|jgi:cytochrome b involved in lipid metabolism
MKSKIIGLIIGIVVLGGLMITSFLNSTQQTEQSLTTTNATGTKSTSTTTITTPTTSTNQTGQQTTPKPPVPTPSTNNSGIPTPPPITSYTSVEVAAHTDKTSCWSIVNGNVYDLTNWISKHPGGQREILAMCGKDATSAFEGQHGGDSKPERILASFFIGALIN